MENLIKKRETTFSATKMGDLIYYEGPFLSHFKSEDEDYFCDWLDNDDNVNRWGLFKITKDNLKKYFKKELTLNQLILLNDEIIIWEIGNLIDGKMNYTSKYIIDIEEFKKYYFDETKEDKSHYNERHFEEYAITLKNSLYD